MINKVRAFFAGGSIRGDVAQIYAFQFLTLGFGLIGGIIVARTLGPSKKGVFDLFNLINSFIIELGLLGFGSGLLYYLANKGRQLSEVHGTGLVFALVVGLLTAVTGWVGMPLWKTIFPGLQDWIILLAFFLAPVAYYSLIWSNIMTGINQAVTIYRIGFYFTLLGLLATFSLWAFNWLTVESIIVIWAFLGILNSLVSFRILYKREPKLKPTIPLTQESLRYGFVIYIGFIANVLHFKIDQVMINYWLGTAAVGIYALSVRWAEMLFLLDSAIIAAVLFKISSSSADESYALTKRLFKAQLVISGASGVLLALLAYPLVLILYGEAYRDSVWPLILLIPGVVAWSCGKLLSQFLTYNQGKFWIPTSLAICGVVMNVILNFLLINKFGINGAAVASTCSYGIVIILTFIVYKKFSVFAYEKV